MYKLWKKVQRWRWISTRPYQIKFLLIKEKEEGLDETCLFQTAWKEWDTEHQWSRTTNWYQQHKKQTKFIEDH